MSTPINLPDMEHRRRRIREHEASADDRVDHILWNLPGEPPQVYLPPEKPGLSIDDITGWVIGVCLAALGAVVATCAILLLHASGVWP